MSFVDYLHQELIDRCRRNPSYSLRAFAAALDLDPSTLSKILRGKRAIGKKFVLQLGPKLGLNPQEINTFIKNIKGASRESATLNETRIQSDLTLNIHPTRLPEAVERIKKFRRSMAKFFSDPEKGHEIYTLSVILCPHAEEKT